MLVAIRHGKIREIGVEVFAFESMQVEIKWFRHKCRQGRPGQKIPRLKIKGLESNCTLPSPLSEQLGQEMFGWVGRGACALRVCASPRLWLGSPRWGGGFTLVGSAPLEWRWRWSGDEDGVDADHSGPPLDVFGGFCDMWNVYITCCRLFGGQFGNVHKNVKCADT